jgi:biopolymer transport protein TolQ
MLMDVAPQTLWELITGTMEKSGSVEKAVFYLLIGLSVASWTIIFWKICAVYEVRRNCTRFLAVFDSADCFGAVAAGGQAAGHSPLRAVFQKALGAMETSRRDEAPPPAVAAEARQVLLHPAGGSADMLTVAMQHAAQDEFHRLQFGLGFLATVGSTAPFIGLFGTVWGIMSTFRTLGLDNVDSASLKVVAPGISSALIATAAGIAVAIPAVMAYNWLLAQIDALQERTDTFVDRLSVLIRASGFFQNGGTEAPPPALTPPAAADLRPAKAVSKSGAPPA